jgi:hypothetical protein
MTLTADHATAVDDESDAVETDSKQHRGFHLVVALSVTTAVWVPLFVARVQAHQANVDDFLYAGVARNLIWDGNVVSAILHSGSTSPLVPTLAAPGADMGGVYGAMTVELPFLLMLVAGTFVLARVWLSPVVAMVAALVVGLNEDVSGYAVMLHFAVPTVAALVWAFASYARSRHFRDWKWSLIFGVSIAAMLLSRSMAIVYLVPLVFVIGIDLLVDIVKKGDVLRLPALAALAIALAVAGPWWLVSGSAALHYLHSAGYQPSAGLTYQGGALNATTIVQRTKWTLAELGWGQSWALGIALLAALWFAVRRRRSLNLTALWMLVVWAVLTSLILSTTSNQGTADGLPVNVILIVVAAAVLGQLSWRFRPVAATAVVAVLAVGLVAEVSSGTGQWWPVAPYRVDVFASGGTARTNVDQFTAQVVHLIGSAPTLVAQDSDLLNTNGMRWNAGHKSLSLFVPPKTSDGTREAIRGLARVRMAVTGWSPGSYHPLVDQGAVESAASRDGFGIVRVWQGSQGTSFVIWRRGKAARNISVPSPSTTVVRPGDGTDVRGGLYLVAASTDRVLATTAVHFTISGSGVARSTTIPAGRFPYGWIGGLNTTTLPDGTYTIRSVAINAAGAIGRSKPVTVHVDN